MFEINEEIIERLPEHIEIPASYYDKDYYDGLPKANWNAPYTWENFRPTFATWAAFLLGAFPEAKSLLDVGCGKGFLERAMIETLRRNGKPMVDMHGFDVSEFGIAHADKIAMPFLSCAGVDNFDFTRDWDVMVCLDLFEHLTPLQAENFLRRSREHVSDCCFFFIATDSEKNRLEPSHITLRDREWWHFIFLNCGWVFNEEMNEFLGIIQENNFIKNADSEAFVYSSQ